MKIIPKPASEKYASGEFVFDGDTGAMCPDGYKTTMNLLSELAETLESGQVGDWVGWGGTGARMKRGQDIVVVNNPDMPKESYSLVVNPQAVTIESGGDAGAFYAVQTLAQLGDFIVNAGAGKTTIPCCEIADNPRFKWRGLMLDVSRHFFGVDEIKRLLRLMSINKLNVFHWHLTDDQGWRVEIKKFPLLTQISSVRKDTNIGGWRSSALEGKPHGGFYTQTEIKDVVDYAKSLNIEILPEIDMPAHFRAAFASYPHLACEEKPSEVPWYFGAPAGIPEAAADVKRIACAGKESTYEFIFSVIDELLELFPFKYFHIGGDEVPKDEWKKCPHCQKAIKDNNLKDEEDLQGFFNNRVSAYLSKHGVRLIGYNEILKAGNLRPDTVAQYWVPARSFETENWVNGGNDILMSKHQAFYFDMCYAQYPIKNTYKFEPIYGDIKPEAEKNILGCEGCIWTEFIADREKIDVNTFPRMQALAEVAWCKKDTRKFRDFWKRWETQKPMYDAMHVNYAENAVANPKNRVRMLIEQAKWYTSDQHIDVKKNRKLKAKKR